MASINQSESSTQPTIRNHLVAEGSKIKWLGSFDDLKAFTGLRLGLIDNWTSPGGSTKLFNGDELTMKYSKKSSVLSLDDESSLKIKDLITDIYLSNKSATEYSTADEPLVETSEFVEGDCEFFKSQTSNEAITNRQSPKIGNLHSIFQSTDGNLHTNSRACNLNTEKNQLNDHCYTNLKEVHEFESKLEKYTQNVTQKLEALADEISTIKEIKVNKAYAVLLLEEVVSDLKK